MDLRNITFMFYGLCVPWLILGIYLAFLGSRENRLRKQLESLKRMIQEKQP